MIIMDQKTPVVVLAGGKAKPEIQSKYSVTNRALIPIGELTMLQHVVAGLKSSNATGPIVVVGDVPESLDYTIVSDHGDFVSNVVAGVSQFKSSTRVLIATSDIPFIDSESVGDFIAAATLLAVDLVYPVVQVQVCYKMFPNMKRTAVPLKEGKLTGGNMMLANPKFILAQQAVIQAAYAARKNPAKLAMMLGFGMVVRLILALSGSRKALDIPRVEAAVGRMLNGSVRAYISPYPEIATDIDRVSDLEGIGESF